MAIRYTSQFTDQTGTVFTLNIFDQDYGGSSPFAFTVGAYGFRLDFEGDDRFSPIIPSTVTLPMIYALEAEPRLGLLLARHDLAAAEVDETLSIIAASGALERARAVALGYIEEARSALAGCPGTVEHGLLEQVAAQVVDRYS